LWAWAIALSLPCRDHAHADKSARRVQQSANEERIHENPVLAGWYAESEEMLEATLPALRRVLPGSAQRGMLGTAQCLEYVLPSMRAE